MRCSRQIQAERIAQLEHKVDHFISLLGPSRPSLPGSESANIAASPEFTSTPSSGSSTTSSHKLPHQGQLIPELFRDQNISHSFLSLAPTSVETVTDDHHFESTEFASVSDETGAFTDPDELLNVFRHELARQVPFISIPARITAQSLSNEKPYLYRAIIAVASYHDSVLQIELGQQFVKDFLDHHVLQGHKSIDLLQGLLVYISW
jgi:hypothetical protein